MNQHVTFDNAVCDTCKDGTCTDVTCGLVVHISPLFSTSEVFPATIWTFSGDQRTATWLKKLIRKAAYNIGERDLEARLAARTDAEVAADEAAGTKHDVKTYGISDFGTGYPTTSAGVAVEVAKLLTELRIEHHFEEDLLALID